MGHQWRPSQSTCASPFPLLVDVNVENSPKKKSSKNVFVFKCIENSALIPNLPASRFNSMYFKTPNSTPPRPMMYFIDFHEIGPFPSPGSFDRGNAEWLNRGCGCTTVNAKRLFNLQTPTRRFKRFMFDWGPHENWAAHGVYCLCRAGQCPECWSSGETSTQSTRARNWASDLLFSAFS